YSQQAFNRSRRVPRPRRNVFPQDAPSVLNRADQSVLVGVVHGTQLTNPIQASAGQFVPLGERLLDPFQCRMASVLHLDPIGRPGTKTRPMGTIERVSLV